ncbi:hypothetical protein PLESTM_000315000 [Pleodorina starrii]|nr:hypothetical protein PLESTM_000315000 [Pleodorina starrii]
MQTSLQVLSYNYEAGELVLATATHYGWYGTNVTIKYELPEDAPGSAELLSYSELTLPYDDLADLALDVAFVTVGIPPPPSRGSLPLRSSLRPATQKAPAPPPPSAPVGSGLLGDLSANGGGGGGVSGGGGGGGGGGVSGGTDPRVAAPASSGSSSPGIVVNSPTSSSNWRVPVAASLAAAGGALLLLTAVLTTGVLLVRRRRQGQRRGRYGRTGSSSGGEPSSAGGRSMWGRDSAWSYFSPPFGQKQQQQQQQPSAAEAPSERPPAGDMAGMVTIVCNAAEGGDHVAIVTASAATASSAGAGAVGPGPAATSKVAAAALLGAATSVATAGPLRAIDSELDTAAVPLAADAPDVNLPRQLDDEAFLRELSTYFSTVISRDRGQAQQQQQARRRSDGGAEDTAADVAEMSLQVMNPNQVPHSSRERRHGPRSITEAIKAVQDELCDGELYLEELIGLGSYGVVYRGLWRGLAVAVKTLVVSRELAGREGRARQQAALEAAISMALAHPNVVVTYSYKVKALEQAPVTTPPPVSGAIVPSGGEDAPIDWDDEVAARGGKLESSDVVKLYIVQEYCNGRTLREALDRGLAGRVRLGGAPRHLALRLALDVARGMEHIHSRHIVHGDLKPDNVLLVWNPRTSDLEEELEQQPKPQQKLPGLVAKVADFGLSTALPEGATHASGRFQGTPAYLAPEVGLSGQVSPRADVWSFGLILVELYFGCSLSAVLSTCWATTLRAPQQQQQGNPPDHAGHPHYHPDDRAACLRETLAAITDLPYSELVGKCVSLEPRQRPGFDEIAAVLEQQLQLEAGE